LTGFFLFFFLFPFPFLFFLLLFFFVFAAILKSDLRPNKSLRPKL